MPAKSKSKTGEKKKKPTKRLSEVARAQGMIGGLSTTRFSGTGGAEAKFYDTNFSLNMFNKIWTPSATADATTGAMCVGLTQGSSASQRIGQKIMIKSIQIRAFIYSSTGTADPGSGVVCCQLVLDRDAKGAAPVITDIFTSANMKNGMINIGYSERFKIIKKFDWNVGPSTVNTTATTFAGPDVCHLLDYYHKEDIPIRYTGATGAIGEITGNNLFLVYGAYDVASLTNYRIDGTIRLRYTD